MQLLQIWLLGAQREMICEFLDSLGIEHDGKGVVDNLPAAPSRERLDRTITKLLEKRSPEVVAVYLHAFQAMDETGWSILDEALATDPRISLPLKSDRAKAFVKYSGNSAIELEVLGFLNEPAEERFESLALSIFNYQRRENPVYAKYCEYLGTPEQVDSWEGIPAVPQIAFKRSEFRSFPGQQTKTEFRTSGTTGEGHGKHFFPSLRLYEAAVQRGWDYFRSAATSDAPLNATSRGRTVFLA